MKCPTICALPLHWHLFRPQVKRRSCAFLSHWHSFQIKHIHRTKAREAATSIVRNDTGIAEIKASLLLLKWMVGFTLAFVVALTWRVFQ